MFLVKKEYERKRLVIKNLKKKKTCKHFKMESSTCLKYMQEENDFLCKIKLRDAHFLVRCQICMVGISFRISLPLLWPRTWTKDFHKTAINPNLSRRPNTCQVIFLDDSLIMRKSLEKIPVSRGTLDFLLQHLGFLIYVKRSVLGPHRK